MAWGAEHGAEAAPKGLGTEEASTSHQQFTQNNTWIRFLLWAQATTSLHVNPTGLTMPHRPTPTPRHIDQNRRRPGPPRTYVSTAHAHPDSLPECLAEGR